MKICKNPKCKAEFKPVANQHYCDDCIKKQEHEKARKQRYKEDFKGPYTCRLNPSVIKILQAIRDGYTRRKDILREAGIDDSTFKIWMPSLLRLRVVKRDKVKYVLGDITLNELVEELERLLLPATVIEVPEFFQVYELDESNVPYKNKKKREGE